jgi:ribosomal-protein-alanine N-acetyltransferase
VDDLPADATAALRGHGLRLRRMRWWDLPAVLALETTLFGSGAWTTGMFLSELADWQGRWYVVALTDRGTESDGGTESDRGDEGDGLVGYAGLQTYADEAYVNTVAVDPACQGQGIGALLLDLMVRQAQLRGAALIGLEVAAGNVAAQRLYASRGFESVGVREGYYESTGEDAVVMVKSLADPGDAVPGGAGPPDSGTMAW